VPKPSEAACARTVVRVSAVERAPPWFSGGLKSAWDIGGEVMSPTVRASFSPSSISVAHRGSEAVIRSALLNVQVLRPRR